MIYYKSLRIIDGTHRWVMEEEGNNNKNPIKGFILNNRRNKSITKNGDDI